MGFSLKRKKIAALAGKPQSTFILFVLSVAESIVFPVPLEVLLIPMLLLNRHKWLFLVFITIAGSVIGGVFGWLIGFFLWQQVGIFLLPYIGGQAAFDSAEIWFQDYGMWAILVFGITPLPYKIATLLCGVLGYPLGSFILLSILSRSVRYGGVGYLTIHLGHKIWAHPFFKNNWLLMVAGLLVLVLAYLFT